MADEMTTALKTYLVLAEPQDHLISLGLNNFLHK